MKFNLKIVIVLIFMFFSLSSFAKYNINLNGRMDYRSVDADEANSGTPNSLGFRAENLRIAFGADVMENLDFSFALEAAGDISSVNKTTNDTSLISHAYFTHTLSDNFSVSVGKLYQANGGYEFNYNPENVYLYSLVSQNLDNWVYGINGQYKTKNHAFKFVTANADSSTDPAGNRNQDTLSYGINWYGQFGDIVKPTLGYNFKPKGGNREEKAMTGGVRLEFNSVYSEIEYYKLKQRGQTTVNKDDKKESIIVKIAYKGMKCRPFIKYINDESDVSGVKSFTTDSYVVAINYHPWGNDKFRYHLAYTLSDKDFATNGTTAGTKDSKTKSVIAGLRYSFDILTGN